MRVARLLAAKDLRMLTRSRVMLGLLVGYPLLLALLLGTLLLNGATGAKIALVNLDQKHGAIEFGNKRFTIDEYRKNAEASGVKIDETTLPEAKKALDDGQVAGILVIPNGFIGTLQSGLSPAELKFYTGNNALGDVITQRVRGVIYSVDLQISRALVKNNSDYLKTLVKGGHVEVAGKRYKVLGLNPAKGQLRKVKQDVTTQRSEDRLDKVIDFASDTDVALGIANDALKATAAPVRLRHESTHGKSPKLTARAMSFALAVSIAFICVVLIAASLAGERDEHVLGRMVRGIATPVQIITGKLALGMVLAVGFSAGLFAVFAVLAPQAWTRLPLLLLMVLVVGATCSSLGALLATLTRDARTATLVAILVVLPMMPIALLGSLTSAHAVAQLAPLSPAQDLFNAVLFDDSPWAAIARDGAILLAQLAVFGGASLRLVRRLA